MRRTWKRRRFIPMALVAFTLVAAGCSRKGEPDLGPPKPVPIVVTADIQAGIENYIEDQVRRGRGYFTLPFGEQDLSLQLVRVHTEYLANLGPRVHFACVDLVDTEGDVYDVDFFLKGDPGAMKVTETTVHKINGKPYYAWDQKPDRTWHRIAVKDAADSHLGVVRDLDAFDFLYRVRLPEMNKAARMWIPLPVSDPFQKIHLLSLRAPGSRKTVDEARHGNKIMVFDFLPEDSGKTLEITYSVVRKEKAAYAAELPDPEKYLNPDRLTPTLDEFQDIAERVIRGKKGNLVRARALYDHVIDRISYKKAGVGWGRGDANYACDAGSGNCTDFHAYFIALARAVRIPARFAIGAAIPSNRDEGGVDGYHCWAEFYAVGKWWPVDISEADKYTSLSTYYFGHHPANRLEFSRGRDLECEPGPASGPINFLAYPVLEVDGKLQKAKVDFRFRRRAPQK